MSKIIQIATGPQGELYCLDDNGVMYESKITTEQETIGHFVEKSTNKNVHTMVRNRSFMEWEPLPGHDGKSIRYEFVNDSFYKNKDAYEYRLGTPEEPEMPF